MCKSEVSSNVLLTYFVNKEGFETEFTLIPSRNSSKNACKMTLSLPTSRLKNLSMAKFMTFFDETTSSVSVYF